MDEKKRKIIRNGLIIITIIIVIGLLVELFINFDPLKGLFENDVKTITNKEVTVTDKGIAEAVDKLYDATVIVEVGSGDTLNGWGSGFVYKTDAKYGYVFTNHHVVDKANKVVVVNTKGEEIKAEVIGSDEYADVAVLKIPINNVLKVAEIGKSTDVRLGDTVFAIGTPVSLQYKFSVTRGILSGKDRMVQMSSTNSSGYFRQVVDSWYMNLLQIDASINSGNSGGPLANSNGEVIGINNSKLSTSSSGASVENIGFAIPIEDALVVADMIINDGKVYRPVIGVTLTDVNSTTKNTYDIDSSISSGALLTSVESGSLADKAGLKQNDVIIKVGEYEVTNYKYFKYYLYRYKKGDKVEITYKRGSKENKTTILLN